MLHAERGSTAIFFFVTRLILRAAMHALSSDPEHRKELTIDCLYIDYKSAWYVYVHMTKPNSTLPPVWHQEWI